MALISSRNFLHNWTPTKPITPPTLKTGFRVIDEAIGGLQAGCIQLVAGRPGMGVSTTLRSIAINALQQGARVLYCTSGKPIAHEVVRMLSNVSRRVRIDDIEWDTVSEEQRALLARAKAELAEHSLSFSSEWSFLSLLDDCRAFLTNESSRPALIVIDNPIILNIDDTTDKSVGQSLSKLAHEFQVPVLLAAGASPDADEKGIHETTLIDVAAAHDLIDFADVVLFLRREEVYNLDTEERGFACLKVVRNRGKSIGRYQFANFFGETSASRHDESIANWRSS
ncbi:MAG: hypothetical protein E6R15_01930 [Zoogloea sp.]|jgi:replicative DNA helicase|nr:MAG: hypothetical protein E6R15_01930 [Zoogloea sp.]